MAIIKLTNNSSSVLVASVTGTDNLLYLREGDGSRFPSLSAEEWFPATLVDSDGEVEIIRVTGRSGDTLTVLRGQESTPARNFPAGTVIEVRMTAAALLETISLVLPSGLGPLPWSLPSPPDGWIFADGRVLTPETPYLTLRSLYVAANFPYGQDGSGNPKIPDARGYAVAGRDDGAGRLSGANALGSTLGAQSHTLTTNEVPAHSHTGSLTAAGAHGHTASSGDAGWHGHTGATYGAGSHAHTMGLDNKIQGYGSYQGVETTNYSQSQLSTGSAGDHAHSLYTDGAGTHGHAITVNGVGDHNHALTISEGAGGGQAHNNVQPTLITNMIVKT